MSSSSALERKKEYKSDLVSKIESGDIVISLGKSAPTDQSLNPQAIADLATHGTIASGNSRVLHATPSRKGRYVQSHRIDKVFERDEAFGSAIVLRSKDMVIQENFLKLIEQVEAASLKNDSRTVFNEFDKRRADFEDIKSSENKELKSNKKVSSEAKNHLELFRAFRSHDRMSSGTSISKNKGVSCGNFISYIVKASIIQKLFPNGIPEEIKNSIQSIEKDRISNANKKLDKVDPQLLEKFEALVLKHIKENQFPDHLTNELYRPVKKRSLKEFVENAIKQTELWDCRYLFYKNGLEAHSMQQNLYVTYSKLPKTGKLKEDKGLKLYGVESVADTLEINESKNTKSNTFFKQSKIENGDKKSHSSRPRKRRR